MPNVPLQALLTMPKLAAIISYDGSRFEGFAPQPAGHTTVTGTLERALAHTGIFSTILGAGRTDKGVHATGQTVAFDLPPYWEGRLDHLKEKLNGKLLPQGIAVRTMRLVPERFHPRFCAQSRTYRYLLSDGIPTPFNAPYVTYVPRLDHAKIIETIGAFRGRHDFSLFCKSDDGVDHTVRTIHRAYAYRAGEYLVCHFTADAYLRSQIRRMVAFLLAISDNRADRQGLLAQLSGTAHVVRTTAPPNGLYLTRIAYHEEFL